MPQLSASAAAPRRVGAPRNWRDTFIAALGETSHVAAAARAAKISLSCVYRTRREDPDFRRRWFAALCEGYDNLEMDLLCWLRTGKVADTQAMDARNEAERAETPAEPPARKFDAATALRVLIAHRESVGKERGRQSLEDESAIIASINAKIDAMRAREKAARRVLAARRRKASGRALNHAPNHAKS